ncbi:MAG: hypothetical protein ABSA97_07785 [Verrucomicrobiia bacterium]|jgi:cell division protein FtsW (lipid II flippase)
MNENQSGKRPRMTGPQILRFIVGVVCFGVLMGIRQEFSSMWVRVIVAGCAGAILAICVGLYTASRTDKRKEK